MAQNAEMRKVTNINATATQYNVVRGNTQTATELIGTAIASRRRQKAREKASAPVIVKKRIKSTPFPVSFVFYALAMTLMLMFLVYSNSVVNEISYDINELESAISETKQENEKLSVELDKKYDLKYIEEVAQGELGLVKSTDVVKHYINVSGGDKVSVYEDETASSTKLDATLDTLKESVAKIYE